MELPAVRVFLVCVLVAGAGWGTVPADPLSAGDGPSIPGTTTTDTAGMTPTEPPSTRLAVVGEPSRVDADRAYRRLQRLYGRDAPGMTVTFRQGSGVNLRETHPDLFFEAFADPTIRIVRPVGGSGGPGRVSVSYRNGTHPERIERVLVHEFAHAFEPPSLRADLRAAAGDHANTTDATLARKAVAEGAAVYVADAYADRYLPGVANQSASLAAEWSAMPDATRLLWSPYRYGAANVRSRVSSPGQLAGVYADPPLTTEGVLHPDREATEPRPLSVRSDDAGSEWDLASVDTNGELYLRVLLESELAWTRAASAAAGWGNDRLLAFSDGDGTSHAWVLRWDTPRDAMQFRAALSDYLDASATRRPWGWSDGDTAFRSGCVTSQTCYVLAGDRGFVTSARVTGNDSAVTVAP